MPDYTPIWQIPYPCVGEDVDPSIFCEFADAVDAALYALDAEDTFARNRPNGKVLRSQLVTPTFPSGSTVTFTWDVEEFDNDGMVALPSPTTDRFTIQTDGVYQFVLNMDDMFNFTTITQFSLIIEQNGTVRARRKWKPSASGSPFDGTQVKGTFPCVASDVITGRFNWTGTGGPATDGIGWFSATFVCDL